MKFKKKICKWGKSSSFSSQKLVTFFSLLNKTEFSPLLFAVQRYFSSLSFCLFRHKKIHCNCKQNVPENQRYHRFSIPPRDFQLCWLDGKIAFTKKSKHFFSKKVANCIAKTPQTVGFNIQLRFVKTPFVRRILIAHSKWVAILKRQCARHKKTVFCLYYVFVYLYHMSYCLDFQNKEFHISHQKCKKNNLLCAGVCYNKWKESNSKKSKN